jgi:hypothetical protein
MIRSRLVSPVALLLTLGVAAFIGGMAIAADSSAPPPPNSRPSAYGRKWTCIHGYRIENGSCAAVVVPAHGYLNNSGTDWNCDRGFRRSENRCVPVVIPEHAYAADSLFSKGWACDRSYRREGATCSRFVIPANGQFNYSGNGWRCMEGFTPTGDAGDACEPYRTKAGN